MASFMDKLKNKARQAAKEAVKEAVQNAGNKTEKIVFNKLPDDLAEFKSLPQADMSTPFETAAMTVVALTYYSFNKTLCLDMLNYLRGPRPLSEMEKQFIADRFRDKDYVPRSYYDGANRLPCCSLGRRILRTEDAAAFLLPILLDRTDNL